MMWMLEPVLSRSVREKQLESEWNQNLTPLSFGANPHVLTYKARGAIDSGR